MTQWCFKRDKNFKETSKKKKDFFFLLLHTSFSGHGRQKKFFIISSKWLYQHLCSYVRWYWLVPALQMIHVPLPRYKTYVSPVKGKGKCPIKAITPRAENGGLKGSFSLVVLIFSLKIHLNWNINKGPLTIYT